VRARLKEWRQEGIRFESRAIIIAHGAGARKGEP
jgi:thioredoxin reductase